MNVQAFDSLIEYQQLTRQVLAAAQRRICWFDADLAETGIDSVECAELIHVFLAQSRLSRMQILLADDLWFWRKCPRLGQLLRQYGHAFEIRRLNEVDWPVGEAFLLTEGAVLRRFRQESPRGELSAGGTSHALCRQRFEDLWQRAEPASEGRQLHI